MSEIKYEITLELFSELEKKVELPKFQRSLVWKKNQKKELIETLSKGYPFGSILISTDKHFHSESEKYLLIDGLQRFSTIKEFKDNPHEYYPVENHHDQIENIIIKHIPHTESIKSQLSDQITTMLKGFIQTISKDGSPSPLLLRNMTNDITTEYEVTLSKESEDSLIELQNSIESSLSNYLNLSNLKIPCIIFKGEEHELANVFENLNKGGVKLNKYQIFASAWDKKIITLNNDPKYSMLNKVLELSVERYEYLSKQRDIKIDNYDRESFEAKREINLFELCYAIGKIALEQLDVFYNTDDLKEELINAIGFSTMAVVLNVSNRKMNEIVNYFDIIRDNDWLEFIIQKIEAIYKEINKYYKKAFRYPGKKDDFTVYVKNFQILSIFACCWVKSFNTVNDPKHLSSNIDRKAKTNISTILKNSIQYYLHDYVFNFWGSTGDQKLDECYLTEITHAKVRYITPIDSERLTDQLITHFEDNYIKENSINLDALSKYLVVIAYNKLDLDHTAIYEFEHIIPKKMVKWLQDNKHIIPGGIVGNITLLNKELNNGKKDKFVYEYINPKGLPVDKVKEQLQKIDYIEEHEYNKLNGCVTEEQKVQFIVKYIDSRTKKVIEKAIANIYI